MTESASWRPIPSKVTALLVVAILAWSALPADGQTLRLLRDVNARGYPSYVSSMARLDDLVVFGAGPTVSGSRLWRTDGTPDATVPIPATPSPRDVRELVRLGDSVLFSAVETGGGRELWRTDGVAVERLTELGSSSDDARVRFLTATGSVVFFTATVAGFGEELYRTDGTATGTERVADLYPGSFGSQPRELTANGDSLFFTADHPTFGRELWRVEGFADPEFVRDVRPGPLGSGIDPVFGDPPTDGPESLVAYQGLIYFVANDGVSGLEIWRSDGTDVGTERITDLEPGLGSGSPTDLLVTAGDLFFTAANAAVGRELWRLDGTTLTVELVTDLLIGPDSPDIDLLHADGALAYFVANDGSGFELWRSDGTGAGTFSLGDLWPGPEPTTVAGAPGTLVSFAGDVVFCASDGTGRSLWRTDGTPGGTSLWVSTNPTGSSDCVAWLAFDDRLIIQATDGSLGREPWVVDATGDAVLLVDINPRTPGSGAAEITGVGDRAFFVANDGFTGEELWTTDGTTTVGFDLYPGGASSSPEWLAAAGGHCYFSARAVGFGYELHRSDGTPSGTELVADIYTGGVSSSPEWIRAFGTSVVFSAAQSGTGREPWISDGTAAGTVPLGDISAGSSSSNPSQFTEWNGHMYFVASEAVHGAELWRSDGTSAGTELVADIRPGPSGSTITRLTPTPAGLFFVADDGTTGRELWRTDGTMTELWADIRVGQYSSSLDDLVWIGNRLYFAASDFDAVGSELWSASGTVPGAEIVADLEPGPMGSDPDGLVAIGDRLYFGAETLASGFDLWAVDLATGATSIVADLPPTTSPLALRTVVFDETLIFSVDHPDYGRELFATDGTPTGTILIADVAPGTADFDPTGLTRIGDRVHLSGDDGVLGREPWVIEEIPPPAVQDLSCDVSGAPCGADLSWVNPTDYDSIVVFVDSVQIETLAADATAYSIGFVDLGAHDVCIVPVRDGIEAHPRCCTVACSTSFIRGDVNADASVDLADAVASLQVLFVIGTPYFSCEDAGDADDDGLLTIGDPIEILNSLFLAGSPPLPPPSMCGLDPTTDALGCFDGGSCP